MLRARHQIQQGAVMKLAAFPIHGSSEPFGNDQRMSLARSCRFKSLPRRHFAQKLRADPPALNAAVSMLTALVKVSLKDIRQNLTRRRTRCRFQNLLRLSDSVQALLPAVIQPENRLPLARRRERLVRHCLTAISLPERLLALLPMLSTARKIRASANGAKLNDALTSGPLLASLNTLQTPHLAIGWDAVFCVSTSRRQRTAHV